MDPSLSDLDPDTLTGADPRLDGLGRIIGIKDDGRPGPLVLLTAGLHGNEPGGIFALLRLMQEIESRSTAGRVVALAGNVGALRARIRHRGLDLNRLWTANGVRALATSPPANDLPDEAEFRALFHAIEAERTAAIAAARPVVLIDLHSTSAGGPGFSVVPDAVESRRLARAIGLPAVLGLEDRIEGPLLTWLAGQGDTAIVVEGGQHDAPETARVLYAAAVVALDHLGVLPEGASGLGEAVQCLDRSRGTAPRVLDLVHAHHLHPGELFEMNPGWENFGEVEEGQPLARLRRPDGTESVVASPFTGYMLMPLYQSIGDEGFFLCRRVPRTWLTLSRIVRRPFFERMLRVLPAVRRVDTRAGTIEVRRGAGPWLRRVLRLFGYRSHEPSGGSTAWSRRPY